MYFICFSAAFLFIMTISENVGVVNTSVKYAKVGRSCIRKENILKYKMKSILSSDPNKNLWESVYQELKKDRKEIIYDLLDDDLPLRVLYIDGSMDTILKTRLTEYTYESITVTTKKSNRAWSAEQFIEVLEHFRKNSVKVNTFYFYRIDSLLSSVNLPSSQFSQTEKRKSRLS